MIPGGIMFDVAVEGEEALDDFGIEGFEGRLRDAMVVAMGVVKQVWTAQAQRQGLHGEGAYVRAIGSSGHVTVHRRGPTSIEGILEFVIDDPAAILAEEGAPAFHLPSRIDWSNRRGSIKRGKNGPYLHVPFEHTAYKSEAQREAQGSTPSNLRKMMPLEIYEQAKRLRERQSLRQGPFRRPSGQMIRADNYRWHPEQAGREHHIARPPEGPRFTASRTGELFEEYRGEQAVRGAPRGTTNPAWKTSRYDGMFRVDHVDSAGRSNSRYLTIRTITPRSPGWWIPARDGAHVIPKVVQVLNSTPHLDNLLASAFFEGAGI